MQRFLLFALLISAPGLLSTPAWSAPGKSVAKTQIIEEDSVESENPNWGFELSGLIASPSGLNTILSTTYITLGADYQPAFFQNWRAGVLGIGIHGSLMDSALHMPPLGFGAGLHLRYQMRYFDNQWVVPMVGYQFEYRTYDTLTGVPVGKVLHDGKFQSPFFGLWVLLNNIDPSGFRYLSKNYGFKKTYLALEMRNNFSASSDLNWDNYDFYIGIRLEM